MSSQSFDELAIRTLYFRDWNDFSLATKYFRALTTSEHTAVLKFSLVSEMTRIKTESQAIQIWSSN